MLFLTLLLCYILINLVESEYCLQGTAGKWQLSPINGVKRYKHYLEDCRLSGFGEQIFTRKTLELINGNFFLLNNGKSEGRCDAINTEDKDSVTSDEYSCKLNDEVYAFKECPKWNCNSITATHCVDKNKCLTYSFTRVKENDNSLWVGLSQDEKQLVYLKRIYHYYIMSTFNPCDIEMIYNSEQYGHERSGILFLQSGYTSSRNYVEPNLNNINVNATAAKVTGIKFGESLELKCSDKRVDLKGVQSTDSNSKLKNDGMNNCWLPNNAYLQRTKYNFLFYLRGGWKELQSKYNEKVALIKIENTCNYDQGMSLKLIIYDTKDKKYHLMHKDIHFNEYAYYNKLQLRYGFINFVDIGSCSQATDKFAFSCNQWQLLDHTNAKIVATKRYVRVYELMRDSKCPSFGCGSLYFKAKLNDVNKCKTGKYVKTTETYSYVEYKTSLNTLWFDRLRFKWYCDQLVDIYDICERKQLDSKLTTTGWIDTDDNKLKLTNVQVNHTFMLPVINGNVTCNAEPKKLASSGCNHVLNPLNPETQRDLIGDFPIGACLKKTDFYFMFKCIGYNKVQYVRYGSSDSLKCDDAAANVVSTTTVTSSDKTECLTTSTACPFLAVESFPLTANRRRRRTRRMLDLDTQSDANSLFREMDEHVCKASSSGGVAIEARIVDECIQITERSSIRYDCAGNFQGIVKVYKDKNCQLLDTSSNPAATLCYKVDGKSRYEKYGKCTKEITTTPSTSTTSTSTTSTTGTGTGTGTDTPTGDTDTTSNTGTDNNITTTVAPTDNTQELNSGGTADDSEAWYIEYLWIIIVAGAVCLVLAVICICCVCKRDKGDAEEYDEEDEQKFAQLAT